MSGAQQQKAQAVPGAKKEQLLGIQALRFVAAFAVVVLHCSFYTVERLDASLGLYSQGANGVRLFFIISGFVMIASSQRLEGTPLGWRVFALKRVVRIVPLYWAVTTFKLATLLAVPAVVLHASLDWPFIAKSYLFIPAINKDGEIHPLLGVGWTLNFEMFFYLLFTLALGFKISPIRLIAPVLIGLTLLSPYRTPNWPVPLQFWADPVVLDFLAGMLLARTIQKGATITPAIAWICVIAGLAYLFLPMPRLGLDGSVLRSISFTMAAALVVAGTVGLEEKIGGLIPKWVLFMGAASYALYLIHPVIAPISPTILKHLGLVYPLLAIILGVALAIVSSIILYMLIEQPVTRRLNEALRKRYLYAASRPISPTPPLNPIGSGE